MASDSVLSHSFNHSVAWGAIKFAFETIVIGILVGGVIDFTFFHDHPAGKAIIDNVKEPLLGFYDDMVSFFGFPEYKRSPDMLSLCADPFTGEMEPCSI